MSTSQILPGTVMEKLTTFSSDITPVTPYRKIYCVGGASVQFKDSLGNSTTIVAADYAAINNQALYITTIEAASTDCTTIYATT